MLVVHNSCERAKEWLCKKMLSIQLNCYQCAVYETFSYYFKLIRTLTKKNENGEKNPAKCNGRETNDPTQYNETKNNVKWFHKIEAHSERAPGMDLYLFRYFFYYRTIEQQPVNSQWASQSMYRW